MRRWHQTPLAIACAGIAFACSSSPPPKETIHETESSEFECDDFIPVSVLVRGETGLWEEETQSVRRADVAGEYVMVDVASGAQFMLTKFGGFRGWNGGCMGTSREEWGTWSLDPAGVKLSTHGGRRVDPTTTIALAVLGDGFALVPEADVGSFTLTGPTRTNCFVVLRPPAEAPDYWQTILRRRKEAPR